MIDKQLFYIFVNFYVSEFNLDKEHAVFLKHYIKTSSFSYFS